jgi:hypothetical protein
LERHHLIYIYDPCFIGEELVKGDNHPKGAGRLNPKRFPVAVVAGSLIPKSILVAVVAASKPTAARHARRP